MIVLVRDDNLAKVFLKISSLFRCGDVAKRSKAAVCKTAIRGFESHRRLQSRGVVLMVARWSPKPKVRVRILAPLPK